MRVRVRVQEPGGFCHSEKQVPGPRAHARSAPQENLLEMRWLRQSYALRKRLDGFCQVTFKGIIALGGPRA